MKILDCTLRDGGYVTGWEFSNEFVKDYLEAMSQSEVDIIELGYKSPTKPGLFGKCDEKEMDKLIWSIYQTFKYCFMIDLKDYIKDGKLDIDALNNLPNADNSIFTYCRIVVNVEQLDRGIKAVEIMYGKGFKILFSIMMMSTFQLEDIEDIIHFVNEIDSIEVVYFADSFGSMHPKQLKPMMQDFISKIDQPIGLHTHNNMGLALANATMPTQDWVDASVGGLGRGAGNLKLEEILALCGHPTDAIEKLLTKYPLLFNMKPDMDYFIAGANNIHQKYVFEMKKAGWDSDKIRETILSLNQNDKWDYNPSILNQYSDVSIVIPARYQSTRFPGKPLALINGKEMIFYVLDAATKALGSDENVSIATDSTQISHKVIGEGHNCIPTGSEITGTDRVAAAVKRSSAIFGKKFPIIVNIQGDEPLVEPSDIQKVIEAKRKFPNHVINCYATCIEPNNSNTIKVVMNKDNELICASRNPIPSYVKADMSILRCHFKQVCIYAYSPEQLEAFHNVGHKTALEEIEDIEILRFIELGIRVKMIPLTSETQAVDIPEDIKIVEDILNKRSQK